MIHVMGVLGEPRERQPFAARLFDCWRPGPMPAGAVLFHAVCLPLWFESGLRCTWCGHRVTFSGSSVLPEA